MHVCLHLLVDLYKAGTYSGLGTCGHISAAEYCLGVHLHSADVQAFSEPHATSIRYLCFKTKLHAC